MKKILVVFALLCLATACGKSNDSEAAGGGGSDQIRDTFMESCVAPLSKEISTGKARTMCACMYDKGKAKWGLGDFMNKATEQPEEVQKIAMECAAKL